MVALNYRIYKVCIVGDGAVGKTTILHQYVDKKFKEDTLMTIGTNFFLKELILKEFDASIRLQIWDLGGQEQFAVVRPSFYAGASGIIYTFDLTRLVTFNNLLNWKVEIENVIGNKAASILVGNKLDLIDEENRTIDLQDILLLKENLGVKEYFETSAKEDLGIDNAFRRLAIDIYKSSSKD
ncbi:MAG: Rab family GTPase [Candidatus Hodarchaeota archaeon]